MATEITSKDLARGHEAIAAELVEATADHQRAALDFAKDRENDDKRRALLKARQRIDALTDEADAMAAAMVEAKRQENQEDAREAEERLQTTADELDGIYARIESMQVEAQARIAELARIAQEMEMEAASIGAHASRLFDGRGGPPSNHYNDLTFANGVKPLHWITQALQVAGLLHTGLCNSFAGQPDALQMQLNLARAAVDRLRKASGKPETFAEQNQRLRARTA